MEYDDIDYARLYGQSLESLEELSLWKRCALILALIALMAIVGGMDARDAEIVAAHVAEAQERKAVKPCDITIRQFGPGERWIRHAEVYQCAPAAREVPNHVLSMPLKEAQ